MTEPSRAFSDRETGLTFRRAIVIGSTGTGKTTFARALADRLGVPAVELDAFHHGPNWTVVPDDLFRAAVAEATAGDGWVADGNYRQVRPVLWPRAEVAVWLDYPLPLILWRLSRRTFGRAWRDEVLWNGNREQLRMHFFSKESLFWWAITTYRRRRRDLPIALAEHPHLRVHRFRRPRDADRWLQTLAH